MAGSMKILIAGIGNRLMMDDGVGSVIAEKLASKSLTDDTEVVDYGTSILKLIYDLPDYDTAILIDSISRGGKPGSIYRFGIKSECVETLNREDVERLVALSYHELDVESIVALAKAWGNLPKEVIIIGVEPATVSMGLNLSETVNEVLNDVIKLVLSEVRRILKKQRSTQ